MSVGILAVAAIASFPLLASSLVLGATLVVALVWAGLVAVARYSTDLADELDVPGVGTVEITIVTR